MSEEKIGSAGAAEFTSPGGSGIQIQEKKNVFQLIHAVMGELGTIAKNGEVKIGMTGYNYATEADFVHAVRPLLLKNNLVMILQDNGVANVTPILKDGKETGKFLTTTKSIYKIVNINDPTDFTTVSCGGQGVDAGDKGVYKAITGAKKYALANTFMIATGDDPEKSDGRTKVSSKKSGLGVVNNEF